MQAFAAGLFAIAVAPEFLAASGEVAGARQHHWTLLQYRMADGEVVAGFGYVDEQPVSGRPQVAE